MGSGFRVYRVLNLRLQVFSEFRVAGTSSCLNSGAYGFLKGSLSLSALDLLLYFMGSPYINLTH